MGGNRRKATWQQPVAKADPKAKAIRKEVYEMRREEMGKKRPASDSDQGAKDERGGGASTSYKPKKPQHQQSGGGGGGGLKKQHGQGQDQPPFKKQRTSEGGAEGANPRKNSWPAKHSASSASEFWTCVGDVDRQCAYAVARVIEGQRTKRGANIKSLTLGPNIIAPKATFAVTCEVLKYLPVLRELVEATALTKENPRLQEEAAFVLVYEELFGQGVRAKGPAERAVKAAIPALKTALADLLKRRKVSSVKELLPEDAQKGAPARPRTVRVNLIKISVADATSALQSSGFKDVKVDPHLDDVLLLPSNAALHDHPLVKNGSLVLQSKASCMPAHVLQPEPGWHVVDCCAAPGNKTTHAASRMRGQGKIFAFDKDPKRLELLKNNARRTGSDKVIQAENEDFLTIDPLDPKFAQVRGVILDPSCSGSGTGVSRMDHLLAGIKTEGEEEGAEGGEGDEERVEALAQFQEKAVRHALKFPNLQRLVYSTCSVHARENEEVVRRVMEEAREKGFTLGTALPQWPRRGIEGSVEGAEKVVRTDMNQDETDGFFVAVFERTGAGGAVAQAEGAAKKKRNKKKKGAQAPAGGGDDDE